ncbi:MAG: sensor histidine kinase [Candidatus Marinimicrobia bacterium]|nr:sensor histidine kinase [Candidatus Neomarinimicrobiota bacterium]
MKLLPYIDKNEISCPPKDGSLIQKPTFCKLKANKHKCNSYYHKISTTNGMHICPYGFSSFANKNTIYTSLLVIGNYNKKKIIDKNSNEFIPKISIDFLTRCSLVTNTVQRIKSDNKKNEDYMQFFTHEIRKLNRDIKSQSEHINAIATKEDFISEIDRIKYRIQNIFSTSSLLSIKLDAFDFFLNPESITRTKKLMSIYKKFEKTKHCLDIRANQEKKNIILSGQYFGEFEAYQVLEVLPFVVLENALKFAPKESRIDVQFEQQNNNFSIVVTNTGPRVYEEESERIFEQFARGRSSVGIPGTGIGLYFAKQVCDLHNLNILAQPSQDVRYRLNDVDYSEFKIIISTDLN